MTTPSAGAILLLDFDGTVCVGDGPVWAYADEVCAELEQSGLADGSERAGRLREGLAAFLQAAPGEPVAEAYPDGYAAVAALAGSELPAGAMDRAYRRSRRRLAASEVSTPEGLPAFLRSLPASVRRMLVTNAPADGVDDTLAALGLADVIDGVISEAGKPAGWTRILPELLSGTRPERILSVGDIWANDLDAPAAAGCATALIDRFGSAHGPVDLCAPSFPELYDGIRLWAADPAAFARARPTAEAVASSVPSSASH